MTRRYLCGAVHPRTRWYVRPAPRRLRLASGDHPHKGADMVEPGESQAADAEIVRNAVLHLANEQPLLADLIGMPDPSHVTIVCTNLRTLGGKRPVFADDSASTFFFPIAHIRFVEIPPTPTAAGASQPAEAEPVAVGAGDAGADLEIDEEFLRRIRDA
jgi:hypothetical protein